MNKTIVSVTLITLIVMFHDFSTSDNQPPVSSTVKMVAPQPEAEIDEHAIEDDTTLFTEIAESGLPEDVKAQLKDDLKSVDTSVDPKPLNKDLSDSPGERRLAQQDMMIIDMMENIENDMNNGEPVEWSEEDKIIIERELNKEIQ